MDNYCDYDIGFSEAISEAIVAATATAGAGVVAVAVVVAAVTAYGEYDSNIIGAALCAEDQQPFSLPLLHP